MDDILQKVPPEVWAQIFSGASLGALSACTQASHLLFDLAVPYLWREIDLFHLLMLLPGFLPNGLTKKKSTLHACDLIWFGQIPISPSLNNKYFTRLNIYATHVRELLWPAEYGVFVSSAGGYSQPTIMLPTLTRSLLPNLTILRIRGNRSHLSRLFPLALEWVKTLVLPISNLSSLYVDLDLTYAADPIKDMARSFLDTILANSKYVRHLKLNIIASNPITRYFNSNNIPHYVTSLTIRGHMLDCCCLGWMAQMGQLTKLRVYVTDKRQPASEIPRLEGIDLPLGSFLPLASLEIDMSVGFLELFLQLWDTPVVSNITKLRILSQCRADTSILSRIATRSPNLRDLQLTVIAEEFRVNLLSPLASLPLRSLTLLGSGLLQDTWPLQSIAQLWPNIEQLSFRRTKMCLLELPTSVVHLPQLKRLYLAPPLEFPLEVVESARSYHLPGIEHIHVWRSRSLNLVVDYHWGDKVIQPKIETLARILVMACPNMTIELQDNHPTTVAFCRTLRALMRAHVGPLLEMAAL
ncbi:hypothetical protein FRC12_010856 [Ceratobasidium sp. 428]|nr:hypothetical protein FRC12_010856 [Ceratobasidium sp. 428]